MKFLFQFLLALLTATLTLAAPTSTHLQRPLGGNRQHQTTPQHSDVGHSTTTPVSTHTHPNERPKTFQLPYVVKAPKTDSRKHSKGHPMLPSWLTSWKKPSTSSSSSRMHFHHAGDAKLACFCAGGAVCCHTATGLDCNSGYCGI
ncbi:hypothetical protein Sste5346_002111 [Sporothrix stenoceras]|uniref:Uncharacterized protein n=1 Tax=Sporothrix stenoceras TaxID=5173 RepID=A0ABR3ZJZ7_9PEZI